MTQKTWASANYSADKRKHREKWLCLSPLSTEQRSGTNRQDEMKEKFPKRVSSERAERPRPVALPLGCDRQIPKKARQARARKLSDSNNVPRNTPCESTKRKEK